MNNNQGIDSATHDTGGDNSDLEKLDLEDVYKKLESTPRGLSAAEAETRLDRYGRNQLEDRQVSNLEKFLRLLLGPHRLHDRGRRRAVATDGSLGGSRHHPGAAGLQRHFRFLAGAQGSDALAALKAGMAPRATRIA